MILKSLIDVFAGAVLFLVTFGLIHTCRRAHRRQFDYAVPVESGDV